METAIGRMKEENRKLAKKKVCVLVYRRRTLYRSMSAGGRRSSRIVNDCYRTSRSDNATPPTLQGIPSPLRF